MGARPQCLRSSDSEIHTPLVHSEIDRIIQALDTSASMIYRVRKQLVEEGFEAVLSLKRALPRLKVSQIASGAACTP